MNWTVYYLIITTWFILCGSLFSFFNKLNTVCYTVVACLFIILLLFSSEKLRAIRLSSIKKIAKPYRLRKTLFRAWLLVVILVGFGGVLHPPSNYDGVTYRLPRVLYWLQNEGWYWIGSINDRMDYSAQAQEWQFMPFFALGLGDRLLFLLNFIPYLLLPALVFKALLLFKCKSKWAWYAMWIFPLLSGFVMQAASIGNDFIGAWLAIAAIAILHTSKPENTSRFIYSALAIGLLSGMKASNLPLYLPLGIVWLWELYLAKLKKFKAAKISLLAMALALCVSFAPTAVLNLKHTGDFFGAPQNNLKVTGKAQGLVGNAYLVAVGCTELPINPIAKKMNADIAESLDNTGFTSWVKSGFPRFTTSIGSEIPAEELSGAGLTFGVLFLFCLLASLQVFLKQGLTKHNLICLVVFAAACASVLAYSCMLASESAARLLLPYYLILLVPIYATASHGCFVWIPRHRLTSTLLCTLPALLVLPGILLTPNRPLIPLELLTKVPLPESFIQRISAVDRVYSIRNNIFQNFAAPMQGANKILFAGNGDNSVYSLFRVKNAKIIELTSSNCAALEQGSYMLASEDGINQRIGMSIADYCRLYNAEIIYSQPIASKVGEGEVMWYLLRTKL